MQWGEVFSCPGRGNRRMQMERKSRESKARQSRQSKLHRRGLLNSSRWEILRGKIIAIKSLTAGELPPGDKEWRRQCEDGDGAESWSGARDAPLQHQAQSTGGIWRGTLHSNTAFLRCWWLSWSHLKSSITPAYPSVTLWWAGVKIPPMLTSGIHQHVKEWNSLFSPPRAGGHHESHAYSPSPLLHSSQATASPLLSQTSSQAHSPHPMQEDLQM